MSDAKTLPRPEDVLDESRIQYQAMTALSDEEYRRLADDIRELLAEARDVEVRRDE